MNHIQYIRAYICIFSAFCMVLGFQPTQANGLAGKNRAPEALIELGKVGNPLRREIHNYITSVAQGIQKASTQTWPTASENARIHDLTKEFSRLLKQLTPQDFTPQNIKTAYAQFALDLKELLRNAESVREDLWQLIALGNEDITTVQDTFVTNFEKFPSFKKAVSQYPFIVYEILGLTPSAGKASSVDRVKTLIEQLQAVPRTLRTTSTKQQFTSEQYQAFLSELQRIIGTQDFKRQLNFIFRSALTKKIFDAAAEGDKAFNVLKASYAKMPQDIVMAQFTTIITLKDLLGQIENALKTKLSP